MIEVTMTGEDYRELVADGIRQDARNAKLYDENQQLKDELSTVMRNVERSPETLPIKQLVSVTAIESLIAATVGTPLADTFAGSKIQMIKHVRAMTGMGLKESKDSVEFAINGCVPIAPYDSTFPQYIGGGVYKPATNPYRY